MTTRKKYIYASLGFLLAFVLQTTVLKHIAIFGWSPNLILCLVVVCSFIYDEKIGLILGIFFGLLLDFVTSLYIGSSSIALVLVYLFVIIIRRIFNHERLLPELLLAGVSTPLYVFTVWVFYLAAANPVSIFTVLSALSVQIVYNGIVIILLHIILVRGELRHRRGADFKGKYKLRGGF